MPSIFIRIIAYLAIAAAPTFAIAQINADQVMRIGQNTMWFEDYVLSIQYFNQAISAKPYLAQPYFYRAVAKLNLDDFSGAEADATEAIKRNPFITDAYEVRGVARQNLGRNSEAVEDYDKALESAPYSRGLLYNKAFAQAEMKNYQGADSTFSILLARHPNFDGGYIGRARLSLIKGDTVAAVDDINKALSINANSVNALVMRADIAMNRDKNYKAAIADMDAAIKLQPRMAGFFINRAFLRYNLDDYYGAMADYDYALQLDPLNTTALYNRALLKAEVHDTNRAIEDLSKVLQLNASDYRAMFNRAILYRDIGAYDEAIADLNRLIEAFPDLSAAYFMRFDIKRTKGDPSAKKDYDYSLALAKKRIDIDRDTFVAATNDSNTGETQEQVEARFTSLITIADNTSPEEIYNNKDIKGKVQDHNVNVELEPLFMLSYYISSTELKPDGEYVKEVADLNDTRMLHFQAQVTNHIPSQTPEEVFNLHNSSIADYTSWLSTHTPRAIDYFGRAMDYITLRDYENATEDLNRAISLTPDFTLAYLARAGARYINHTTNTPSRVTKQTIIDDLDTVIKLSPKMAIAHYNKGVILAEMQDYTSAIAAFSRAIELKPDFGEAYYNRGFVYLKLGNRNAGVSDLSKAGELGIVPSYNLLKRMSH